MDVLFPTVAKTENEGSWPNMASSYFLCSALLDFASYDPNTHSQTATLNASASTRAIKPSIVEVTGTAGISQKCSSSALFMR